MKVNTKVSLFIMVPIICAVAVILAGCVGGRGNGGGCARSIAMQPVYETCNGGSVKASFGQATQDKIDTEYTTRDFIANCIIALCKDRGYTDAATKGVLGYCLAEGTGFGSFTYESYWCFAPIDKGKTGNDTTLDNNAWKAWLDANRGNYPKSANHSSFGLGIFQMSDTPDSTGATTWVQNAMDEQYYWQDPYWNVNHSLDIFENYVQSDTQGDSFDPHNFNGSTEEGIGRCTCLVGMPGWTYPSSGDYWNKHIGQASEAEQKFNSFPNDFTVPTFGKAPENGSNKCGADKSGIDNSSIASCAVSLSFDEKNPDFKGHERIFVVCGSTDNAPHPVTDAAVKQRQKVVGDSKIADCGCFVATVIRSTVDQNYPEIQTSTQENYMKEHSDKYECIKTDAKLSDMKDELQPGDIFVHSGHTFLYVGYEAIVNVFDYVKDEDTCVCGASWNEFGPKIQTGSWQDGGYSVYRFIGTPDPSPSA